jgi:hypothetical protein
MKNRRFASADFSAKSTIIKYPPPTYLERALQSLAFFGYQDSRIPANRLDMAHRHRGPDSRELFEGANSDELTRLFHAHTKECIVLPEQAYALLVPNVVDSFGDTRADIVIVNRADGRRLTTETLADQIVSIIEINRATASTKEIQADIRRLQQFLTHTRVADARAFLVLAAQRHIPRRPVGDAPYVNQETGLATKGPYNLHDNDITYRVRRLLKAATSFNKSKRAHYVLLFEVERPLH